MDEKTKTVVVERVPEDVVSQYKAACAVANTSMRADLIEYMTGRAEHLQTELYIREQYIAKHGKAPANLVEQNIWLGSLSPQERNAMERAYKGGK